MIKTMKTVVASDSIKREKKKQKYNLVIQNNCTSSVDSKAADSIAVHRASPNLIGLKTIVWTSFSR